MRRCPHCGHYGPQKRHCPSPKRTRRDGRQRSLRKPIKNVDLQDNARFEYKPLIDKRSIRLLKLFPGKSKSEIRCKLRVVPVDSAPPYVAISYVWGDANDKVDIVCQGRKIRIPRNLKDALSSIRLRRGVFLLWADSICINQSNNAERGDQVQIMGDVYRNAIMVVIWLGNGENFNVRSVFGLIDDCTCADLNSFDKRVRTRLKDEGPEFLYDLGAFLDHPWFTRLWIVQELGLASCPVICCGKESAPWYHLIRLCGRFDSGGLGDLWRPYNITGIFRVDRLWNQDFNGEIRLPIVARDVFHMGLLQECSDDHDRVYALLGHHIFQNTLASKDSAWYLPVDYETRAMELYTTTCRLIIESSATHSLSILSLVWHDSDTIQQYDRSSWAFQWDRCTTSPVPLDSSTPPSFSADGNKDAAYAFEGCTLVVEGLSFDAVVWTSDVFFESRLEQVDCPQEPNPFLQFWHYLRALQLGARTALELMCFCLTSAMHYGRPIGGGVGKTRERAGLEAGNAIDVLATYLSEMGEDVGETGYSARQALHLNREIDRCNKRRAFVTSRGWVGMGPGVMSVGDDVCILFGASTPVVLWELPSASEKIVKFCGECYVHGLMDGEAIEMWDDGALQKTTFKIV